MSHLETHFVQLVGLLEKETLLREFIEVMETLVDDYTPGGELMTWVEELKEMEAALRVDDDDDTLEIPA